MRTRLPLFLAIVLTAGAVHAQGSLSSSQVERFLNTLEKLNELPETEENMAALEIDPEELQEKMTSPFTSSLPQMRDHEMYSHGLAIMKSEGFSDEVEWASVGDSMLRAYLRRIMLRVAT